LVRERRSILNKIDAILATLGVKGYRGLRSDRREQLGLLRQLDGDPVPQAARVRIERLLDRLELILRQIKEVEAARDAVLKKPAPADEAERMIRSLVDIRAIGPQLATLLVREAFSRPIANRRALGSYVGLAGTPFSSSGGSEREQGIGKDGNRRVRAAMVELAWLWLRWQPDSTLSAWFRERVGKASGRIKKIMIVALARKLLIALWRYAKDGVIPEGAKMKTV
jgi:transposase